MQAHQKRARRQRSQQAHASTLHTLSAGAASRVPTPAFAGASPTTMQASRAAYGIRGLIPYARNVAPDCFSSVSGCAGLAHARIAMYVSMRP